MANHYQPSAVLRDNAKGFLNGKYKLTIGSTMVFLGLTWVFSRITSDMGNALQSLFIRGGATGLTASAFLYFINNVIGFILTVFLSVLEIGLCFYYLKIGTGQMPKISDIFYGFREDPKKSFKASALVNLPKLLSIIPGMISLRLYLDTKKSGFLLTAIILELVGAAVYIFFSISFKMTYFILADFPEYTAMEAVKASWTKISGHRGRLFGLMLSFIPYYLLAVVSLGAGFLWLYPLIQESYAQFYLDLMNPKKVSGEWERTV